MSAPFELITSDPQSRARTGKLNLAHGTVHTPAFVPLATKGTVKGLLPSEVADLGYEMVLGNTYHLFLDPGHDRVRDAGGLHEFMRWDRPIITDSGGFQVFSMGHGTVADEIKGRASHGAARHGKTLDISEDGVRFRSHVDGSEKFLAPETSMEIQHALGSDIALVFDECTPFNVTRDYTARSTERTHRWLERCLVWHEANGSADQLVYGIVQGGIYDDMRVESAQTIGASRCGGIAIGGSLGAEKDQMYEVVGWTTAVLPEDRPRHLLGIGDVDDLIRGVELGIDTFDCAMPTRLGRHGVALIPDPDRRWRVDLTGAKFREDDSPLCEGCPCPACTAGFTRSYLRYLLQGKELTALRLLVLHNLAFIERLMRGLRDAINENRLADHAAQLRAGAMP